MTNRRRIGVLTSGGDCAGLNAVLRAVVQRAVEGYGWHVVGIHKGTAGLLSRPVEAETLDLSRFQGELLRRAGTILGTTNKGNPFNFPLPDGRRLDRSEEIVEGFRELEIEGLIGIGGDGSLAILSRLCEKADLPLIGIPKTIDNDVAGTEVAIGYATAVGVATDALDHLQPTAASHDRIMVLEVMGRDAGHIALAAGIAGGADIILVPEIPYSLDNLKRKIDELRRRDRNFALVVVAEAVRTEEGEAVTASPGAAKARYGGIGHYIGQKLAEATGAEVRVTVLGHVQRGGTPVPRDRLMASIFGVHAVDLLAAGKRDRMVAWSGRTVTDLALVDVVDQPHRVDPQGALVHAARGLGICLGDR
ncbi:ATP-dependent 6-phosphofructokinase [Aquibaculum arenosum]|uniref:ATP-dependent 6-phosphofructokinase n=1 Tax=Aquibaculum arenosum TaxID=3032591 RepID=A0ABT5YI50_9PROT|nr:ATP-dependent 6-phosphofructokinase [Fodinicurvata sp. CAU 1616]MDF2094583.1 ATP-dependent 6-phosphofructokinase [Fodinicurvata sp. CAU 1616]